ncbi:galactose-specific lectin nattectin-like isoform X1 [Sander lucioperca]|uniref:galactose-specific lectin nattectin-like isoform X1 n=1 Tax=Sander lucioperca TaxID=283035 RepID=UPI00125E2144|nr:galactose-specific lectin nattectin-like isoform X1 [Sander lucioperca]
MTSVFLFALLLCLSSGLLAAYGAPSCPTDWTSFGSRCFAFYGQPKTWIDAELFCQSAGGHLASIHSDAEHEFIRNNTNQVSSTDKNAWIGGFDAMKEGMWMWADGSQFDYQSWAVGKPDHNGGTENCLEIYPDENWNNAACTNQASFVCSKNLYV